MIDIPNLFQNSHKIKSTVIEKDIIPNIPIIPNGPGNNNGFSPKIMKYFVTSIVIYPKMFRPINYIRDGVAWVRTINSNIRSNFYARSQDLKR